MQLSGFLKVLQDRFMRIILPVLSIVAAILLCSVILYINRFNYPYVIDDFSNAMWDNFLAVQWSNYLTVTGRYTLSVLVTLTPLHWYSLTGYRLLTFSVMLTFLITYYSVMFIALRRATNLPAAACMVIASCALLIFVNNIPSLAECFYWLTSSLTYAVSLILTALLFIIFLRLPGQSTLPPKRLTFFGAALLIILIIGCNETIMLLVDLVCLAYFAYYKVHKSKAYSGFFTFLLLVCIACTTIVVLSPGNMARQVGQYRHVAMILPTWLYNSQKNAFKWITDPFFLIYSALVVMVLVPGIRWRIPRFNLLASFSLPFLLMLILSFPVHVAYAHFPPARVYNLIYAFFLPAWTYFLLNATITFRELDLPHGAVIRQTLIIIAGFVILLSANNRDLRTGNLFMAVKGLNKGILQNYGRESAARYAAVELGRGKDLVVPALSIRYPNVLYMFDLGYGSGSGRNKIFSNHMHIQSISLYTDTTAIGK